MPTPAVGHRRHRAAGLPVPRAARAAAARQGDPRLGGGRVGATEHRRLLLTALGLLFLVAYLGDALGDQRAGVRDALAATRSMLWPGLGGPVVTWAAVMPTSMVAGTVGLFVLPIGTVEDTSLPVREYLLRLVVMGPLLAVAVALLALVVPRIMLDGERDLGRAVGLSLRVAVHAFPVCLLVGVLLAAPMVQGSRRPCRSRRRCGRCWRW